MPYATIERSESMKSMTFSVNFQVRGYLPPLVLREQ